MIYFFLIFYIFRINRILETPRGNAILVGVGGSGKQSLARLAAFISSMETFQIQLKKGYGIHNIKVLTRTFILYIMFCHRKFFKYAYCSVISPNYTSKPDWKV